jgi:hypothetical protein
MVTAEAVRELRLKKGQIAAALIKSTEVMIVLPYGNADSRRNAKAASDLHE